MKLSHRYVTYLKTQSMWCLLLLVASGVHWGVLESPMNKRELYNIFEGTCVTFHWLLDTTLCTPNLLQPTGVDILPVQVKCRNGKMVKFLFLFTLLCKYFLCICWDPHKTVLQFLVHMSKLKRKKLTLFTYIFSLFIVFFPHVLRFLLLSFPFHLENFLDSSF